LTEQYLKQSDIEDKLKLAEQRVSYLTILEAKFNKAMGNIHTETGNKNVVFQNDNDIASLQSRIRERGFDTPTLFTIWLDSSSLEDEKSQDRDLDVDAATIIYNFAIFYMREAQTTRQTHQDHIMSKQRSLHLMELAHSILARHVCAMTAGTPVRNDRHTLMMLLVTRSLYHLYACLQLYRQAITARMALVSVWESICHHYQILELLDIYNKTMAASAA
jgi:hypothetical protein